MMMLQFNSDTKRIFFFFDDIWYIDLEIQDVLVWSRSWYSSLDHVLVSAGDVLTTTQTEPQRVKRFVSPRRRRCLGAQRPSGQAAREYTLPQVEF